MANQRTVMITGGQGRLATQLATLLPDAIFCSHKTLDVTDPLACYKWVPLGGIVIHCAALLSNASENNPLKAWAVNVEGTRNIVNASAARAARLVYISSDYVFSKRYSRGQLVHTNAEENDPTWPVNFYGVTKVKAETIVRENPNNLILRAPFRYGPPWIYDNAFVDQWTSARWLGEVAPDIVLAATSHLTDILHIGGPRRSIYELASSAGPVKESVRSDWPNLEIPIDTSLNSSKWLLWKKAQK